MGLFDKVKDIAADAGDRAKDLGQQAQTKLELRKLEARLEETYTTYGRRAHELAHSGGLSREALSVEESQIHEAKTAVQAKKSEVAAEGASDVPPATA